MNENHEIETDTFDSELESDKGKNNYKIYILLLLGTVAIGALIYNYTENAKKPKIDEEDKIVKTNIIKKAFERKTVLPVIKKEVKKQEPLPLLPTPIKRKTYRAKIIKSTSSTVIKFNSYKEDNRTSSNFFNKNKIKDLKKNEIPYHGGISTVAGVHHFNPNLSLARGTYIGCSLQTKIVSAVGGQIACTVTKDIYSASGNVLLIEKGSKIVGQYKSAQLKFGLDRLYVIWDEIRTPNNIVVNVSSGASDPLGAQGIHGSVDYNWGIRIGAALLVSLIDDALGAAASRASDKGTNYLIETGNTSETMSERVLNRFINIPPVLYKNQGDIVGVFVNKDIDFSKVYKLTK